MKGYVLICLLLMYLVPLKAADLNSCFEQDNSVFVLDLSENDGLKVEGCEPGKYQVKVINVVPHYKYSYKSKRSIIPNQKLINPNDVTTPVLAAPGVAFALSCDASAEQTYKQILAAKNEIEVAQLYESIETELVVNPGCVAIQNILESARKSTQTIKSFLVGVQEQVTIEIKRDKKGAEVNDLKWSLDISTHKKGEWNASWAVVAVQNKNRGYFSRANDNGTFTVTEKNSNNDLTLIPAVFYTYTKYKNHLKDLQQGPTLGLGLDSENLTPFFGWNWTYNGNIGMSVGGAFYKRSVLLGEYQRLSPGTPRVLNDNIATLTEDVYKLGGFVAFSYRF